MFTLIYIAMIAYALFLLIKRKAGMDGLRFTNFIGMIRGKLFTRTDMFQWLHGKSAEPPLSDFERLQDSLSFT